MPALRGTPRRGLLGATLGFFVGFAAVALFGPMAHQLQSGMHLSPVTLGFVVAAPLLSGSLLRIPFSAWVDTTGGRKPFLILLGLSILGMAGLLAVFKSANAGNLTARYFSVLFALGILCGCGIATFSVGIGQVSYWFPQSEQGWALGTYAGVGNMAPGLFSLLLPLALVEWGLSGAYCAWLIFLAVGTLAYASIGCNAWYFQLRQRELQRSEAWRLAREHGQELFPRGNVLDGLILSAKQWQTWALVALYLATFGGFLALTAWLPTFWASYYRVSVPVAGALTALFSLWASVIRIAGGSWSDRFGGEKTAIFALSSLLVGSLLMSFSAHFVLSILAELLIALGMGVNNAAVFKMVPGYAPDAVGGASGWVGGLGALGGFVVPPIMGFFVQLLGRNGYARGFLVFTALAAICLTLAITLNASALRSLEEPLEGGKAKVA